MHPVNPMYYTTTLRTTLIWMALAFLLGRLLTCNCGNPKTVTNTVVKSDTVVTVIRDTQTIYKPVPVRVSVPSLARIDSFIQFEKADTAAILANCKQVVEDYLSEKTYKEKYRFDDGVIEVESQVKNNELFNQVVRPTFLKTIVTNSITVQAKRRNEVYVGVDGYYSEDRIGAGASLMFLHKKGWGVEVGSSLNQLGQIGYNISYKRKLSFK